MKTIKILIILLIISQFFTSCIWSNHKVIETKYIPEEMKSYIMFPEGSWWVYEDTVNNIIDSLYLQKQTVEMLYDSEYQREFEHLSQEFFTRRSDYYMVSQTSLCYEKIGITIFYNHYWGGILLEVPVNERLTDYEYLNFLDSVTIDNQTYYDVKIYTGFGVDTAYWSKNIGVIKIVTSPSDSTQLIYLLKKYHINN